MSTTTENSPTNPLGSIFSSQGLVIGAIGTAVAALLFFLLFSIQLPNEERPFWYLIGTYIFECSAFLIAGILSYRNWQSPKILSGRNVWAGFCVGMFAYFLGNLAFGLWELYWHLDPDVSLGDVFYVISYVAIAISMLLVIFSRRLNLEIWQWIVLGLMVLLGSGLAAWLSLSAPTEEEVALEATPVLEQVAPAEGAAVAPEAPAVGEPAAAVDEEEAAEANAPGWVVKLDLYLQPLVNGVNLFYIVADVVLFAIATALLLAFWGGRSSRSWQMIAFATFSLFIADMWFKYAETRLPEYQSGDLIEVFFVFCGVLFWLGAVLEYDVSASSATKRSRRAGRRRTAS